jgi:hypothetical protein
VRWAEFMDGEGVRGLWDYGRRGWCSGMGEVW